MNVEVHCTRQQNSLLSAAHIAHLSSLTVIFFFQFISHSNNKDASFSYKIKDEEEKRKEQGCVLNRTFL